MPYAPGIQYRGDQYLFNAISGAGDAFADALAKRKEQQKSEARQADLFRKVIAEVDPENADLAKTWNSNELKGHLLGIAEKAKNDQAQAAKQHLFEQTLALQREREGADALQTALGQSGPTDVSLPSTVAPGVFPGFQATVPASPSTLLNALTRNPKAVQAPQGQNLLMEALRLALPQDQTHVWNAQAALLNAKTAETRASQAANPPTELRGIPVKIDGELKGYMVGNVFKPKSDFEEMGDPKQWTPATDMNGKVIPDLWFNPTTKKTLSRSPNILSSYLGTQPAPPGSSQPGLLQRLFGTQPAPPPTEKPAPAAAPAKQPQGGYRIGMVYQGGMIYLGGDPADPQNWRKQ